MTQILRKIFDIRPGEEKISFLMFFYIFLVIASLLIMKPVRNSLFLNHLGIENLPYAFILVAFVATIMTHLYSKFSKIIQLNRLIANTIIVAIISLIVFWILLQFENVGDWFYYLFYVWVALYGVILTSQFWLLANYVFNAREAKRLFGFIGAGAISGGIFGGYLTKFLAPVFGTTNMLFFCLLAMGICWMILNSVWNKYAWYRYNERLLYEKKRVKSNGQSSNFLSIILKSRHVIYLSTIIGIGVVVANLVDYQYNAVAKAMIQDEDQLTAFFGFWLSNLSIASLLIQLIFTGRILKAMGVTISLLFLPIGILIGTICLIVHPSLASAVLVKVSDGGFKQSIYKAGIELLALPLPGYIKNRAKTFIDVFIDSLATGLGGLLIIIITRSFGLSVEYISLLLILLVGIWIFFIIRIRKEYLNSFRQSLEKGSLDIDQQTINLEDASVFNTVKNVLEGNNEKQILYILELLENVRNTQFIPYLLRLLNSDSSSIKIASLRMLRKYEDYDYSENVNPLVLDDEFEVKVEAIRYLYHCSEDGLSVTILLLDHDDYRVRSASLVSAAYAYKNHKSFRTDVNIEGLIDQFFDNLYNENYDDKAIAFMKQILARVIGIAGEEKLNPFLKNLLGDKDWSVVRESIRYAGQSGDSSYVPVLINHLRNNAVRKEARIALSKYGEQILPELSKRLHNQYENRQIRLNLIRVLSLIGTQRSVNILLDNLDQRDIIIRHQNIKALSKIRDKFPGLKFDREVLSNHIIEETKYYYLILNLIQQQNISLTKNNQLKEKYGNREKIISLHTLLVDSLDQKLESNLERIFRLLGLKYPQKDVYNAYLGIKSKKSDLKANAIEFLDNILDLNFKRILLPLLEETSLATLIARSNVYWNFNILGEEDCYTYLLDGDDNWLRAITIFLLAETANDSFDEKINCIELEQDPIVKETVDYYCSKITKH